MTRYDTHFVGQTLPSKVFYRFGRFIVSGGIRVYTRMSIIGRENLPATGAFVLSPVHRSYIDTPISGALTTRRLRFLGKIRCGHRNGLVGCSHLSAQFQ